MAVKKPDGSTAYTTATRSANGLVDSVEIWALNAYMAGTVARGDLVVYDVSDLKTLEEGERIDGWSVEFETLTPDTKDPIYNTNDYYLVCINGFEGQLAHCQGIDMIKKIKLKSVKHY